MAVEVESVAIRPPLEWWQWWAERRREWWSGRPVLARRVARVRAVGLWVGLVWVAGVLVFVPEVRLGARAYLGCLWVVVAWFAVARTKTLTWSGFMRLFAFGVPWAVLIAVVSTALARTTGLSVSASGPTAAIAALTEESLKLLPIGVIALMAPRRAARFATVDWALLGLALGTAFTAAEEAVRRTSLMTTDGFGAVDLLLAQIDGRVVPEGFVSFRVWPVPTSFGDELALYAGHGVVTGLVAAVVGLSIAAWHASRRLRTRGAAAVRVAAFTMPVLALLVAVGDHVGINVQDSAHNLSPDGTPQWLDPATTTVPIWIRGTWSLFGHGHGRVVVFVVLVLAALLVDAARLARTPAANLRALPVPPRAEALVGPVARGVGSWPHPLARSAVALLEAALALVWLTGRDLTEQVTARAHQPGQARLADARAGAVTASTQRALREGAFAQLAEPVSPRRRRVLAGTVIVVLGLLALVLAPHVAQGIGMLPFESGNWLAGLLNSLAHWWNDQPWYTQFAIGAGIAALVVLSGGSLGFAMGVSGVATWGLTKGAGIATFIQDPERATTSYLTTATPAQMAADTLGVALTFAPGDFAGGLAARSARTITDELITDPALFWARRRAAMLGDAGEIRLGADAAGTARSLPTPAEAADLLGVAEPTGSAFKSDAAHRAGDWVIGDVAQSGSVFDLVGGDGVPRTLVQMPGELNGVPGRFEWIMEGQDLTHQLFVRNGTINGIPIKP